MRKTQWNWGLALLILTFLSAPSLAGDYWFGMVQDADGWTNVRFEPNLGSKVLTKVSSGDRVLVVRRRGEFLDCLLLKSSVDWPETFGYIHSTRVTGLKPALGAGVVNDPDGWSNLRGEPAVNGRVLQRVRPADGFFVVLDREGYWLKVKLVNGTTGWLHTSRVEWILPKN